MIRSYTRFEKIYGRPMSDIELQTLNYIDETPQKKYADWLIKIGFPEIIEWKGGTGESAESIRENLSLFDKLIKRNILPKEKRDIMQLQSIESLKILTWRYKDKPSQKLLHLFLQCFINGLSPSKAIKIPPI